MTIHSAGVTAGRVVRRRLARPAPSIQGPRLPGALHWLGDKVSPPATVPAAVLDGRERSPQVTLTTWPTTAMAYATLSQRFWANGRFPPKMKGDGPGGA